MAEKKRKDYQYQIWSHDRTGDWLFDKATDSLESAFERAREVSFSFERPVEIRCKVEDGGKYAPQRVRYLVEFNGFILEEEQD